MSGVAQIGLRAEFSDLFWDCRLTDLSAEAHQDFIVERILSRGSWDQIRLLRAWLGDDVIQDVLEQHRGRTLSRAQLRLWEVLLDLPAERVNTWIAEERRQVWDGRLG